MRNSYKWIQENTFSGKMQQLIPVARIPVIPGDTLSGKLMMNIITDTFLKPITHSMQMHLAMFYVPNRVAWDGWPEFIASETGTVPTDTVAVKEFFEPSAAVARSTLYRRAYSQVVNEYYRDVDDAEFAETPTAVFTVPRLRTLETTGRDDDDSVETVIDGMTLNDFRRAYSKDKFDSRRKMYGDRYSDYLKALGVRGADPELIDVPEMLLKKNIRMQSLKTYRTDSVNGQASSIYLVQDLKCEMPPRKFLEHGYVVGVLAVRPRLPNRNTGGPPDCFWTAHEDFWSPPSNDMPPRAISNRSFTFNDSAEQNYYPHNAPLLVPMDLHYAATSTPLTEYNMSVAPADGAPATVRNLSPSSLDGYLRNLIGNNIHFQGTLFQDLTRETRAVIRA